MQAGDFEEAKLDFEAVGLNITFFVLFNSECLIYENSFKLIYELIRLRQFDIFR